MPILTTQPISLPGGANAQHTAIGIVIQPTLSATTGVGGSALITSQRYLESGPGVIPVGPVITHRVADIYAAAAGNPALAGIVTDITNQLAQLVTVLGL